MATTYPLILIAPFGGGLSGQSANVRYTVYDSAGAVKLGPTLGTLTEETDDDGNATTGTYHGADTGDAAWAYPLRVKYTMAGQAGISAQQIIGSEFATLRALAINANGQVQLDTSQVVPIANTANSIADCLNAARANGFGAWRLIGNLLTMYAADGITPVHTFLVDSPTMPTQRV